MNGLELLDEVKIVMGCAPAALASTAGDGDYVSLKNFQRLTIVIAILNGTTVTGTAISLLQATDVAAAGVKALGFTKAYRNIDCAAADTLAEFAVAADTFTTDTTNAKQLLYVIEILPEDLDVNGGFDCLRVEAALAANSVGAILYLLHGARYGSPKAVAAITN